MYEVSFQPVYSPDVEHSLQFAIASLFGLPTDKDGDPLVEGSIPNILAVPEQADLSVAAVVGLHALEDLLGVVENQGSGIQGEGCALDDRCVVPSLSFLPVDRQHARRLR